MSRRLMFNIFTMDTVSHKTAGGPSKELLGPPAAFGWMG